MNNYQENLLSVLRAACPPERLAWLEQASDSIRNAADPGAELALRSAMARRKMGDCPLPPNLAPLDTPIGPLKLERWATADLARTVLMLTAVAGAADHGATLIDALFRQGDESERATIARALALFDNDGHLKHLIAEAGRANSQQLITAVSLHNPYPRAHYSDAEFNQMVLKNLFLRIPIAEVAGLNERANAELSRMCEDYYHERSAAGRDVPEDIWLAMGPHASQSAEEIIIKQLAHDDPGHRCYAAKALGARLKQQPQLRQRLEERTKTESDAGVLKALQNALTD